MYAEQTVFRALVASVPGGRGPLPAVCAGRSFALVGHVVSVGFCPYARLTSYLVEDWRKDPDADGGSDVDYPIVEGYAGVFAAALMYRAVIVGAVVLAFCLGL